MVQREQGYRRDRGTEGTGVQRGQGTKGKRDGEETGQRVNGYKGGSGTKGARVHRGQRYREQKGQRGNG